MGVDEKNRLHYLLREPFNSVVSINEIQLGRPNRAFCEPSSNIDKVADFILRNEESRYFFISAGKSFYDHTTHYYLKKQKPEKTA